MLSMVSGSKGFAPNPADGLDLHLRAAAPAGVDDRRGRRVAQRAAPCRRRVYAFALLLLFSSLMLSLGGWIAKQPHEEVRDPRLMAVAPRTEPRARCAAAQAPRRRVAAHLALARPHRLRRCAGRRASPCARSPARSSSTWRSRACSTSTSTCSPRARSPRLDQPSVGRLPRPDPRHGPAHRDRDRDRHADRRRHRGLDRRVRAPAWLARAVESGIEIVAGTPDIVIAIFGLALFQQSSSRRSPSPPRAAPCSGARSSTAGAMMSLHRAAAGLRRHARGAAVDPAPRARGLLRARQDAHRDDPPRPAAPVRAEHRHRRGARHGPHRRRHRDRRGPARRHAAASSPRAGPRRSDVLRGTGSTLTSYVYNNSPAGEGNAPQKAYAAAFVLLLIVIAPELRRRRHRRRGARTGSSDEAGTDSMSRRPARSASRTRRRERRPPARRRRRRCADRRRRRRRRSRRRRSDHGAGARAARGGRPRAHDARRARASPTAPRRRSRTSRSRSARARCSRSSARRAAARRRCCARSTASPS